MIDEEIIRQKQELDQDSLLSKVECPIRIIHGTEDDVVPIETSRRAVQKLEDADIREIEGLTHSYDKKLDEVAEYTLEFFRENMPISET